jgi:hypothetical protein
MAVRVRDRAEGLVGGEPDLELQETGARARRHQHPARLRQVRRDPAHLLPLERRGAHEGHVPERQVAEAAVDQLGGAARRAGGEVAGLEERDAEPPARRLPGDARAADAAPDHGQVEAPGLQAIEGAAALAGVEGCGRHELQR